MLTAVLLLSPTPPLDRTGIGEPCDAPNVMPKRDAQSRIMLGEFTSGQRKTPDYRGFLESG
jgi:hypothetical protein